MSKRDIGRGVLHNESCPLKADKCDKETDANADCEFQITRHSVDDRLPNPADRQNEEEHAREEHRTERNRPVQPQYTANIVGKKGIQPHPRCKCDRIVGKEPHRNGS